MKSAFQVTIDGRTWWLHELTGAELKDICRSVGDDNWQFIYTGPAKTVEHAVEILVRFLARDIGENGVKRARERVDTWTVEQIFGAFEKVNEDDDEAPKGGKGTSRTSRSGQRSGSAGHRT